MSDASGGEYGADPIVFTVTRTVNVLDQVSVNLGWSGTAVYGTDYTVTVTGGTLSQNGQTLTLAAGAASATVTVTPVDDTSLESAESVILTLKTGTGYALGSPVSATGSIADNDASSTISIVGDRRSRRRAERRPDRLHGHALGEPVTSSVVVNLAWSGTATFGTDYTVSVSAAALSADRPHADARAGVDERDDHDHADRRRRNRSRPRPCL